MRICQYPRATDTMHHTVKVKLIEGGGGRG
ncbi:hypothetical protein WG66_014416 [Moniliophthora roreri]|nr:hypothetical protein WG66_014416 [Moniliophthora roreri]